ncbi:hypothetical protein [Hymenobacter sp. B81]|uniref:hypothetical protein n=1 Tax=Hymenobacter sp. B81 TaxID=3344878 RepID=UPI0037DD55AA
MVEVDLIKKHGKKALGMTEQHGGSWKHRAGEILLEIAIIVFAILLSMWLHDRHEQSVDRETERKFLVGLRADLTNDLKELRSDSLSYCHMQRGYRFFRTLTPQTLNPDSVKKYQWTLGNTVNLVPNNSRFEGLKSSGKLGVIEDEQLLNSILENYQELIPGLLDATRGFTQNKEQKLSSYLEDNLDRSSDNFLTLMTSFRMRNYLDKDVAIDEIVQRYHHVMENNRGIIRRIDQVLADK